MSLRSGWLRISQFAAGAPRWSVYLALAWAVTAPLALAAQDLPLWRYVDPMIGTQESDVITRWGNEGGTYPGAVAVSGFMQLSPETRSTSVRGYNYRDHSIYFFSCTSHASGFPGGSSGRLYIMPLAGEAPEKAVAQRRAGGPRDTTSQGSDQPLTGRPFTHTEEYAEPGYYRVRLDDDGTIVEAVATTRAGEFRIHFPRGTHPRIFLGGIRFNDTVNFSEACTNIRLAEGGRILSFAKADTARTILVKVGSSTLGAASAQRNIDRECALPFDSLRSMTRSQWNRALSAVIVNDPDEGNKTIFYTALYHSLLIPWTISDVDGNYRGADGKLHHVSKGTEYGEFSPWDSFRSLHPLLSLLFPDKESDMVRSMLDIYLQSGYLPVESMTGNHSVSIIVDSYLKGIPGIDKTRAYEAMSKSIVTGPFIQSDFHIYRSLGYIPFVHPESVTRTLEYAYDDWALGQFAGKVMGDEKTSGLLDKASFAYRRLFYPPALLMLPRDSDQFKTNPGNSGYKEGDAWAYSYFVPQDPTGLIDIMGGPALFARRLDSALGDGRILFDNETVLETPYLFNEAGFSSLTQKWVRAIMHDRYQAIPGGLPGNDDLGAMSSWYVLSALGLFPAFPGRPLYEIGSPLFHSASLRMGTGRRLSIVTQNANVQNIYIRSLQLNGRPYEMTSLSHRLLADGGQLVFDMGPVPGRALLPEVPDTLSFRLSDVSVTPKPVGPGEWFTVRFSLRNMGREGTMQVVLYAGGKVAGSKNCWVASGQEIRDSIACRLFRVGSTTLQVGETRLELDVKKPDRPLPVEPDVSAVQIQPVIREGDTSRAYYTVINTGWERKRFFLPLKVDQVVEVTDTILLDPGEQKTLSTILPAQDKGLHHLDIGEREQVFKVYSTPPESCVLDLSFDSRGRDARGGAVAPFADLSGFENQVVVVDNADAAPLANADAAKPLQSDTGLFLGRQRYLQIYSSPSMDKMDERLTMMLWVRPQGPGHNGLTDIFTKGDNHVLQVSGGKTLTFFAGGWGRGDCTVKLPADWWGHWHHIAGVCSPDGLRLYIDGRLRGYTPLDKGVNLSIEHNQWVIGRNEEFPGQRIYEGYIDKVRIYQDAMSAADISSLYQSECQGFGVIYAR